MNGLFFLWVRQTLKYFFLFSDSKHKDGGYFGSQRKKVHVAIYPFKHLLNQVNVKKRQEICGTLKNYASYIHTFSLTDNFENSRKKRKKRKRLSFRSSLPEVVYKKVALKNFAKFCARLTGASFLIKLQAWGLQLY